MNSLENRKISFQNCIDLDDLNFDETLQLELNLEQITLSTRAALAQKFIYKDQVTEYKSELVKAHGIKVRIDEDDVLTIDMPLILPFKKVKKIRSFPASLTNSENEKYSLELVFEKANLILDSVGFALDEFLSKNDIDRDKYNRAVFVYTNFYDWDSMKFDTDNFEYKQITDAVASRITNGNDNDFTFIMQSKRSEKSFTRLQILPEKVSFYPYIQHQTEKSV